MWGSDQAASVEPQGVRGLLPRHPDRRDVARRRRQATAARRDRAAPTPAADGVVDDVESSTGARHSRVSVPVAVLRRGPVHREWSAPTAWLCCAGRRIFVSTGRDGAEPCRPGVVDRGADPAGNRTLHGLATLTNSCSATRCRGSYTPSWRWPSRPRSCCSTTGPRPSIRCANWPGRISLRRPMTPTSLRRRVRARLASARLRALVELRSVTWFTALAELSATSIPIVAHEFEWTRSVSVSIHTIAQRRVVLGSSLAADGLIGQGPTGNGSSREIGSGSVLFAPPSAANREKRSRSPARLGAATVDSRGLPIELVVRDLDPSVSVLPSRPVDSQ